MTGHDPKPVRARDGLFRWSAACPCTWSAAATSKEDAERRCREHAAIVQALAIVESELREACYSPAQMEYFGDGPCLRCTLRDLLGSAA